MNTFLAPRAEALKQVRRFFDDRGYLEVDVPALSPFAPVDTYIDPLETKNGHFLHTSPEYAMKKLLTQGSGNIYFLGHVYRKEELGSLHNPEFTMIEWYKTNTNEESFLHEVAELLFLFLPPCPVVAIPYHKAWDKYARDPELDTSNWQEDEIRHYTFATSVEPNLGIDNLTILTEFPKADAALARTRTINGIERAERYEFFYRGIELANGFHELSNPAEQEKRFHEANQKRLLLGKDSLPIDTALLTALSDGLPENTYGIAAGFDRLLMLKHHLPSIHPLLHKP